MLAPISGCVHLAVAGGCGGTTWGLQHARQILSDGHHVVWICEEIPDGNRFSQLFSDISPIAVSKLHLSAVGENTDVGIKSAMDLLGVLENIALVVVDDWTKKTGKPSGELRKSMQALISTCTNKEVALIAISSAYEDAGGAGGKARGSLEGCDTWFLHRGQMDSMMRELHIRDVVTEYVLGDEGFIPRK